ncbi:MAG: alanine/glycine:cation symporter family protein [Rikenellaceae bacterium]
MDIFRAVVEYLNSMLWSYILVAALLGCAIYFTIRSRFVQFRMFREMVKVVGDSTSKSDGGDQISSFQAFAISLASRVGTGNLAGVAVAIAVCGPGSIFWMWVVALLGAASAFVESTLAQLYKRRADGVFVGGPAYYMERGLKARWMGVLFAVLISVTFGFAFNSVQSNTICGALEYTFGYQPAVVGGVLTLITVATIFGGIHRIAKVCSVVVPFMALGYILLAFYVVVTNFSHIPHMFGQIVGSALGFDQAMGGLAGVVINAGVKRGLFSNEAGMGSAPNAAATASVTHPVKQGLIQSLGVFVDTLVICSSTAFIILLNQEGVNPSMTGIQITQQAIVSEVGSIGGLFITAAILLFAFSSIIGNYYYGETNIRFITPRRWAVNLYRIFVAAMVMFGALVTLNDTIILSDLTMALMTLCNLVAIVLLGGKAIKLLGDYQRQRGEGVESPVFEKSRIAELDSEDIECW